MASIDQLKSLASSKLGFARTNQFLVELPQDFASGSLLSRITELITSGSMGGGDLNLLCASATMPGKQVLTHERRIGMEMQKVAYGYAVDDVSLTFYAMNDYGIKKYFDTWIASTVDENNQVARYKNEYQRDVKIHQLRKPILNKGFDFGPIGINVGIGGGTAYSVQLQNAFPTTISAIELNNELDGLVQVSVQLSYTRWRAINDTQGFISVSGGFGSIFR